MIEPIQIVEESDTEFTIKWSDESETRYNALALRRRCPCAMCINEWTGEKMLVDDSIPEDIKINSTAVVGRYALNFVFSDQHDSGIFSFQYLREIAE
ncbi:MAG TPA: DUF971 domain-containing protein [Pyrinomonadaceae bacterium]|nr:DUF971 domain-containing protein [Pyrinomonadaceae bacterium]HMU33929.1 DUF971 domain-containing protein [Pyrinomonadaceae bacterium]